MKIPKLVGRIFNAAGSPASTPTPSAPTGSRARLDEEVPPEALPQPPAPVEHVGQPGDPQTWEELLPVLLATKRNMRPDEAIPSDAVPMFIPSEIVRILCLPQFSFLNFGTKPPTFVSLEKAISKTEHRIQMEELEGSNRAEALARMKAAAEQAAQAKAQEVVKAPTWEQRMAYARCPWIAPTQPALQTLIEGAGLADLVHQIALRVEPFTASWEAAELKKTAVSVEVVTAHLRANLKHVAESVSTPGEVTLGTLADRENVERHASTIRTLCHESQRNDWKKITPIILEGFAALQEAARERALETEEGEKAAADNLGIRFSPSPVLKYLTTLGFDLKTELPRHLTTSANPRTVLWGLFNSKKPESEKWWL